MATPLLVKVRGAAALTFAALCGCACGGGLTPPPGLDRVHTTERFVIRSDVDAPRLAFQAHWIEGFWRWFESTWFPVRGDRPLQAWLFGDPRRFLAWKRESGGPDASGYYHVVSWQPVLVVNLTTGYGTSTHELVHHFVFSAFGIDAPPWFNEGFAAFFEKFLAHVRDDGELVISVGYFSNWRFPEAKSNVDQYQLDALLSAGLDVDQTAARSLMLFLHRQQKLKALVTSMLERRDDPRGAAALARAWGAPLADLEQRWKQWIRAQPIDAEVLLVPQSTVLPEAEWREWLRANEDRLQWSEAEQRYVPRPR
ncbi:MAG TPA: hypothetical protein VF384_17325 [Planctomycetota bacterium]